MENDIQKAVENIFTINLGVKTSDKVLVFSDTCSNDIRDIGRLVTKAGRKFADDIRYVEYNSTHIQVFRNLGCHFSPCRTTVSCFLNITIVSPAL